jgi:hypothetical protein
MTDSIKEEIAQALRALTALATPLQVPGPHGSATANRQHAG